MKQTTMFVMQVEVNVLLHSPFVESRIIDLLFKHCVAGLVRNDLIQS
jgi:hypothetical protein